MSEMKFFPNSRGAHKYAENASRKYHDDRYIVSSVVGFYVQTTVVHEEGEHVIAHYKNGEKQ